MGSREIEPTEGTCDACGAETTIVDFMGDCFCYSCLDKMRDDEEEHDDE